MWVELEVKPLLKCNFPYVCENSLMKIRGNLLWASPLWTPVLWCKQLNDAIPMGKECMTLLSGCEVFLKEVKLKL